MKTTLDYEGMTSEELIQLCKERGETLDRFALELGNARKALFETQQEVMRLELLASDRGVELKRYIDHFEKLLNITETLANKVDNQ